MALFDGVRQARGSLTRAEKKNRAARAERYWRRWHLRRRIQYPSDRIQCAQFDVHADGMFRWERFEVPVSARPRQTNEVDTAGYWSDPVGCMVAEAIAAYDEPWGTE